MLHLRMIVHEDLTDRIVGLLTSEPGVTNLVVLRGAAVEPAGDMVSCDVAREAASYVIAAVRDLADDRACSIAVEEVDTSLSAGRSGPSGRRPGPRSTRWCGRRSRPAPATRPRCRPPS